MIVHSLGMGEIDLVRRILSTPGPKLQSCACTSHSPKPLKLVLRLGIRGAEGLGKAEAISLGEKDAAFL